MADHCGVCRSVDVAAGTGFRTCLSCGASTSYGDGKVVSGPDVEFDAPQAVAEAVEAAIKAPSSAAPAKKAKKG